jgi:hypothetical protein
LNNSFTQLIADLNGAPAVTSATAASAGTSSAASTTAATNANAGTAALQSFLTNFLQGLQNSGSTSTSALGVTVNTTA